MLKIFTVAFFGHRYIKNVLETEALLKKHILKLLDENEYVDFLVGRNGDFDLCATTSVKNVREKYKNFNSSLVLVLPYATAEYLNNKKSFEEYYSDIEVSDTASVAHPKAAIQIRNKEIVDRADLIICYVTCNKGGAFQTLKYALKQNKKIIHIAPDVPFNLTEFTHQVNK